MQIRAVTYNVFHCAIPETGKINYDFYAKVIKGHNADFVGLQEVDRATRRSSGKDQVKELASRAGYPYYAFGKAMSQHGGDYCNALLSKYPIADIVKVNLGQKSSEPRCLLYGDIVVEGLKFKIGATHLGGSPDNVVQATNMKSVVEGSTRPWLIAGDYNCTQYSSGGKVLDSYLNYSSTAGIDHVLCRGGWTRLGQKKIDDGNGDHDPVVATFGRA